MYPSWKAQSIGPTFFEFWVMIHQPKPNTSNLNCSNEILFLERPNPNDNFVQISKWSASHITSPSLSHTHWGWVFCFELSNGVFSETNLFNRWSFVLNWMLRIVIVNVTLNIFYCPLTFTLVACFTVGRVESSHL